MKRLALLLPLLILLSGPVVAKDRKKKDPAVDPALVKIVEPLIEKLADPSFKVREEASRALMALGPDARPALLAAQADAMLEVRSRISRVLLHYREIDRRRAMGSPAAGDWPMLRRTPGRGGSDNSPAIRRTPGLGWVRELPGRLGEPQFDSPFIVVENRIVSVFRDGRVFAIDRDDGRTVWTKSSGGRIFAGPVMAAGVIYIPGMSLTAMDARQGKILWRFKTDYGVVASPLVSGGRVFAVEKDERIVALDPANGEVIWKKKLRATRSAPVAVNDLVIVGTATGVSAYNLSDGQRRWSAETPRPVSTTPVVLPDRVVIGDAQGGLYAVSLDRGKALWSRRIPDGHIVGTPAVYGDSILFSTSAGTFRSIRALDGGDRWTRFVGSKTAASPCIADSTVYVSSGRILYAMECADGDDVFRMLFDEPHASPVIMDKTLYLMSANGKLFAY
jgi:outer membrane protein assembly factor BamB